MAKKLRADFSNEFMLSELTRIHKVLNRKFTQVEFDDLSEVSAMAVRYRFGGWPEALAMVGLSAIQTKIRITPEKMLEELVQLNSELGGLPSRGLLIESTNVSDSGIKLHFNTYAEFVKAAGLSGPAMFGRDVPEKERIARRSWKKKFREKLKEEARILEEALGKERGVGSQVQTLMTEKIRKILDTELVETEKGFDWLINPDTFGKLKLDAYFPEINLAFEYQSELHFMECQGYSSSLTGRLRRDFHKRNILQTQGIKLLEVAYFEPKNVEYLTNKINLILNNGAIGYTRAESPTACSRK